MSSSKGHKCYFPAPRGLLVATHTGRDRVLMTDQELSDDIVATLPKLRAAVARDTYGRRWKQGRRRHGVDCYELSTGADPDVAMGDDEAGDDLDVAHAVVAKAELRCHLNEVLSVLLAHESPAFEATMQALVGHKFKKGAVLLSQKRRLSPADRRQSLVVAPRHGDGSATGEDDGDAAAPEHALLCVTTATLRPPLTVKLSVRHKRTQRLCLSTFTQQYAAEHRAVHVLKTLPKAVHDELVVRGDRSALRRELDHLAVGFHIESKRRSPGMGGSAQVTHVFAHGYASPTAPARFGELGRAQAGVANAAELARRREGIMNPEAKHVLRVLTKSLRNLERVVRRRRLGFQSFLYLPVGRDSAPTLERACGVCSKRFSVLRRGFFCQLCGHLNCRDCSQLYEVEPRVGVVRRNRCCLQCIANVDACVFDDEDLLEALDGPTVVDVGDTRWLDDDAFHLARLEAPSGEPGAQDAASASSAGALAEQLRSADAKQRSAALKALGELVRPVASQRPYQYADPAVAAKAKAAAKARGASEQSEAQQVAAEVERFLSASLRRAKDEYRSRKQLEVAPLERDYVLEFDEAQTGAAAHPLPPAPSQRQEATRRQWIERSGVLRRGFDRSALDLLAEVAAKRLGCPIGFVSVVDDQFHAVGAFNLPEEAWALSRANNVCIHQVYGDKPLVLKNPQRDMRFAHMPSVRELGVKFYAGFPVRGPDGSVVASLCAVDAVAHSSISSKDYATMETLAKLAAELVAPRDSATSVARCEDELGTPKGTFSGRGKPAFVY